MIFEMPTCTGCRTCEMVCSFRRYGEFKPKSAAIRIVEKAHGLGYEVHLVSDRSDNSAACSGCSACVESCPAGTDLHERVLLFLKEKKASSKREKGEKGFTEPEGA
jgi:Fe-S oxidoreductase